MPLKPVSTWCVPTGKLIAWLRGDPESVLAVKRALGLLAVQGHRLFIPRAYESRIKADAVVLPLPGSPEERFYSNTRIYARLYVRDPDPWRALFRGLASPRGYFNSLIVGVDTGSSCAISAIGDEVLIWAEKCGCAEVGRRVKWILSHSDSLRNSVFVGSGPGLEEAEASLIRSGIDFKVVREDSTTAEPLAIGLKHGLRDKDLEASIKIALKGAYGD